jgi:hypothetical protein
MSKKQLEKIIVAGDGHITFGMGVETAIKLPFLTIGFLEEPKEIGEDVMESEKEEILTILFKNLESLSVVEKMCSKVREYLENKEEKVEIKN